MKRIEGVKLKNTNWSGGKTKELFIYPENKSYEKRDFDFRISSATVEVLESKFTSLPKYNRILMVLEGELELIHENHYSTFLKEYDIDNFSGSWNTTSKGKVTDYNLMTSNKYVGKVRRIDKKSLMSFEKNNNEFLVYYCYFGEIEINNIILNKGDVLVIYKEDENKINIDLIKEESILIESSIKDKD